MFSDCSSGAALGCGRGLLVAMAALGCGRGLVVAVGALGCGRGLFVAVGTLGCGRGLVIAVATLAVAGAFSLPWLFSLQSAGCRVRVLQPLRPRGSVVTALGL